MEPRKKVNAVFTLLVYYKVGHTNGMKYHSYKQEKRKVNGREITDERYALNRLVNIIENMHKGLWKTAILYHNPSEKEVLKYSYGFLQNMAAIDWEYTNAGDILFRFVESEVEITNRTIRKLIKEEKNYRY